MSDETQLSKAALLDRIESAWEELQVVIRGLDEAVKGAPEKLLYRQLFLDTAQLAKIVMEMPDDFRVEDARRAHVLLRCTQEILTNTIRHARAETLWLRFAREADGSLTLRSRDDGIGVDAVAAGNGLSGMRERIKEFGGSLDIDTAPGRGFALAATLPMETKP